MNDIEKSRQAISDFLANPKAKNKNAKSKRAAAKHIGQQSLPVAAFLAQEQMQTRLLEPLQAQAEQVLPVAEEGIRRYPWLSLAIAGAAGATLVLSPKARQWLLGKAKQQVSVQELKNFFFKKP